MLAFFYAIPPAVLLFVALALAISFAAAGQTYVHRLFNQQDFIAHNEVGGILITVSGTLYAVVLLGGQFKTDNLWTVKTDNFRTAETREFYFDVSSVRKSVWTFVRQLFGPHLRTCA